MPMALGCSFFARLGATRGGSPGIFGYTGGHGASSRPAARSRSCRSSSGSSDWRSSPRSRPRVALGGDPGGHGGEGERRGGRCASSSSQRNGVDTWPCGLARTHHAPKTVLWGAFWLKSTNTRLPPLLLPPGRGDQVGPAPLELPGDGHRGGPHLVAVPPRLRGGRRRGCPGCRWSSGGTPTPSSSNRAFTSRGRLPHHREGDAGARGRGRCAARRRARGRRPWSATRGSRGSPG